MQRPRLLAVGLADLVLARVRGHTQEVVEGHVGTLVRGELIADSEDLAVCKKGVQKLAMG